MWTGMDNSCSLIFGVQFSPWALSPGLTASVSLGSAAGLLPGQSEGRAAWGHLQAEREDPSSPITRPDHPSLALMTWSGCFFRDREPGS